MQTTQFDIIDLLGEKYAQLRKECDMLWRKASNVDISASEWQVLARIYHAQPTVPDIAKHMDITRQAAHKRLNGLREKGIVEFFDAPHNRRDKSVRMTALGEDCYARYLQIKQGVARRIAGRIGEDTLQVLQEALERSWFE